ncbi:uncharacterized protein PV09_04097 [Verruconis gallopava]|uniref:Cytochrome P450 monooxygenase n=1 Tax=Verruconis gallopava TaxID=253628 RepID=A0A0D2B0S5_9PEZI|nr:uncharacterized protein PV09_04097 [Verruconis gallopava]KIW04929.1 hypothetical protein PV09_04097 [Verruconis gallopava]
MILSLAVALYLALLVSFVYKFVVYPLFLSPLSKLPRAHPTSPILPAWYWYQVRRKHETRSIVEAHRKYGPVVLLSPNEISVASLDGLKKIYSGRRFKRPGWFVLSFTNYNTKNLVTMSDTNEHAKRKKTMLQIYNKAAVIRSVDFHKLSSVILSDRLLPVLDAAAQTAKGVDVYELMRAVAAEIGSAYEFGLQNGLDLVRIGREEARKEYLKHTWNKMQEVGDHKASKKWLEVHCLEICTKTDAELKGATLKNENPIPSSERTFPVAYAHLDAATTTEYPTLSTSEKLRMVASEMLDNLEASREADGVVLTYAMYELCRQHQIREQLRKELNGVKLFANALPRSLSVTSELLQSLDRLPLLDAIIKETMRLYSVAPGLQRRDVPPGGVTVDGYFIPAGTVVGTSQRALHRNEQVFTNADAWIPQRWMKSASERASGEFDPAKWWWAFGSGAMACSGKDFALIVMKLILATIYLKFDTEIVDDTGIEQIDDGFMSAPVGNQLILGFKSVN